MPQRCPEQSGLRASAGDSPPRRSSSLRSPGRCAPRVRLAMARLPITRPLAQCSTTSATYGRKGGSAPAVGRAGMNDHPIHE